MRPPLSATSSLRPHSSASIDRHKLPSLHSHNTSLPALYLPSQAQSQGLNENYSLRDVGVTVHRHTLLQTLKCSFSLCKTPVVPLCLLVSIWALAAKTEVCHLHCANALQCWMTHLFPPASAGHRGPAVSCWPPRCFFITHPTRLYWPAKLSSCVQWAVLLNHTSYTGSVPACVHTFTASVLHSRATAVLLAEDWTPY